MRVENDQEVVDHRVTRVHHVDAQARVTDEHLSQSQRAHQSSSGSMPRDPEIEERLEAIGLEDEEAKERWLRNALREALHRRELATRFEAEVRKADAGGPGRVWTDAHWEALKRGEYVHTPEPDSWAVPPGWKSPRSQ